MTEKEITFYNIIKILWDRKFLIIFITVIVFIFGLNKLQNAKFLYLVNYNITAVKKESGQNIGALGTLASIAGLNIGGKTDGLAIFVNMLKSRVVAEKLAEDKELYEKIFEQEWVNPILFKKPKNVSPEGIKSQIRYLLGIPLFDRSLNAIEEFQKFLIEDINVEPIGNTGMFSISSYSAKPEIAKETLKHVVFITDEILKERDRKRTESNIEFINKKLKSIKNKDQRSSLISALGGEQRTAMLTSSDLPYVAEGVGVPFSSPGPLRPNVTLNLVLYIFFGGLLGCIFSLMLYAISFNFKLKT